MPYWYIDTGFAALLILLAVVDEGLGAVFFGPPDIADFRTQFGVPPEWTPIGAIAVGHPDPRRSRPARTPSRPQEPRRTRAPRPLRTFAKSDLSV